MCRKKTFKALPFGRAFLLQGGEFMDKLQERAIAFRHLMNYQYVIKLGRKGQIYSFVIDFQKQDFFHLIGLQKLIDLRFLKRSAEYIFNGCLKGNLTYSMLEKSDYFEELGYRLECFHLLENILDDNELVFKCNINSMRVYSNIKADYMLQNFKDDLTFYIFRRCGKSCVNSIKTDLLGENYGRNNFYQGANYIKIKYF